MSPREKPGGSKGKSTRPRGERHANSKYTAGVGIEPTTSCKPGKSAPPPLSGGLRHQEQTGGVGDSSERTGYCFMIRSLDNFLFNFGCDRIGLMEERHSAQLGTKKHQCDQCPYSTDHTGNLKQHQRTHTGEKPFQCTVCEKAFVRSSLLQTHQRTHTGEKPFKCTLCGKAFAQSSILQTHQRTHTGEKPFKCTLCGSAFSQSSAFVIHQRTHTGEKPFKCNLCRKTFAQSSILQTHQRTHTGEKPFKCTLCGKAFSQSSALVIHQRTHTGEKPFKCTLCQKAFGQSSNLKTHQRTHTQQKIYKKWSLKSACKSAAMSPSLMKQEPEENHHFNTLKGIKVNYEEAKVKCEEVTVKVKFEDDSTPKSGLHIDGGSVKQEQNSDCEAERGNSQQFVEVEVWVDFLDNTKSNVDQVDMQA